MSVTLSATPTSDTMKTTGGTIIMPMNIVIQEKRKALGLTQEQVAEYKRNCGRFPGGKAENLRISA